MNRLVESLGLEVALDNGLGEDSVFQVKLQFNGKSTICVRADKSSDYSSTTGAGATYRLL